MQRLIEQVKTLSKEEWLTLVKRAPYPTERCQECGQFTVDGLTECEGFNFHTTLCCKECAKYCSECMRYFCEGSDTDHTEHMTEVCYKCGHFCHSTPVCHMGNARVYACENCLIDCACTHCKGKNCFTYFVLNEGDQCEDCRESTCSSCDETVVCRKTHIRVCSGRKRKQ